MAETTTPAVVGRNATLGVVLGLDAVGSCLAISGLIFAGPLVAGLGGGVILALVASILSTLVLLRYSGLRPALGIAQDTTVALMAGAASAAAAVVQPGASPVMTAFAVVGLSTFLTALLLIGVARLGLSRVIGLLPYPVSVGFLASSGWLLCIAALGLLVGANAPRDMLAFLTSSAGLWQAMPGIALALALFLALRLRPGPLTLVVVLALALAAFHAVIAVGGLTLEDARAMALLPDLPRIGTAFGITPQALTGIDWTAILSVSGLIGAIVLINLISVTLNTTSTEMAIGGSTDLGRELESTGWTNAALGLTGAPVAYLSGGSSIIAHRLGARHPTMALAYVAVLCLALAFSDRIVPQVPVFLTAGLMLYFGLAMLEDWLWQPMARLVRSDRLAVLAILVLTIWQGILVAVSVGLLIAVLAFLVGYARVPPLRGGALITPRRSTVDRGPVENANLLAPWAQVRLARLQGFLFFGSVDQLLALLARPPGQGEPPRHLIVDFTDVTGVDSSACLMLEKLGRQAQTLGIHIAFCGLSAPLRARLDLWQPGFDHHHRIPFHTNLETALEATEVAILSAAHPVQQQGLSQLLASANLDHDQSRAITALLHRIEIAAGGLLIQRGSTGGDVYIVESGRFDVFIESTSGARHRVRSFMTGAIIGELAHLLAVPRQADVIARCDSVVMCLPAPVISDLAQKDPALAAVLYRLLAVELATKVVRMNQLLVET
jgi:sulfate permease, SulP family